MAYGSRSNKVSEIERPPRKFDSTAQLLLSYIHHHHAAQYFTADNAWQVAVAAEMQLSTKEVRQAFTALYEKGLIETAPADRRMWRIVVTQKQV